MITLVEMAYDIIEMSKETDRILESLLKGDKK